MGALLAGALSSLRRVWAGGRLGADWASPRSLLGQFSYSTYRESDYDVIWDRYAYMKPLSIWFKRVNARDRSPPKSPLRISYTPHALHLIPYTLYRDPVSGIALTTASSIPTSVDCGWKASGGYRIQLERFQKVYICIALDGLECSDVYAST